MTAEDIEARLAELPVGSSARRSGPALMPAPFLPAGMPSGNLGGILRGLHLVAGGGTDSAGEPPEARHDPSIPAAYRGEPRALHGRAHPALRKATIEMPTGSRYGALFLGPSGCGKSSAAAWALRRWKSILRGTLGWIDAIQMTDGDRRYRLGTGDPEELAHAYRCDWLVLDDVNLACSATLVQLVLARRYQAALPTIVTSGLRSAELADHIGVAAVRRIAQFRGVTGLKVDCHAAEQS